MKIIIAEDDLLSSKALEKNIIDWGYKIVVTKNGEEAWKALMEEDTQPRGREESLIRMAILDWEMPKIDGVELCRRIRERSMAKNKNYVYIILLTGRDRQEDIIKGLSAGADDYMTKPYNFLELKVRLKNGERIIQLEDTQQELANTDGLTKLWNRSKIQEFLEEEIDRSSRYGNPTGVIMIDIDLFKHANDTYGHLIGDKVLSEVASRMKKAVRQYDKIGRYGGDEFLAVFPNCRKDHITHIAERLRRVINNEKFLTKAGTLKISISIGGTSSEFFSNCTGVSLIEASDKALLSAKSEGRNRVIILDPQPE